MKKLIFIIASGILLIASIGTNIYQYRHVEKLKNELKSQVKQEQVKCNDVKQESPVEKHENKLENNDINGYIKPCLQYLKAIKNGKSTDLSIDKINNIKAIMSEDLYHKLVPDLSDQELEIEREKAKSVDDKYITVSTLKEINTYYSKKDENKVEVAIIYTTDTKINDRHNSSRYLTRFEVTNNDEKNKIITNIYEDSLLSNGLYGE